jgi:hypothetical protein
MPTYVYEIIAPDAHGECGQFEVFQRMMDPPLTHDPDSGQPVRRVISGGIGIKLDLLKRSTVVNKKSAAARACGCGGGKPHRHAASEHRSRVDRTDTEGIRFKP